MTSSAQVTQCKEPTAPGGPPEPPSAREFATVMVAMEIADEMTRPGNRPYPCAERIIARLIDSGIIIRIKDD